MFKIAIIGRPNVGKSTLFNKLVGRSFAITDNTPGVTRDRKESKASLGPLEFMVIDTAGLESEITSDSLEQRMVEQTQAAVADADLCLFIVDGKSGITNQDLHFSKWLKRLDKKTMLLVNKCENMLEEVFEKEYYKLGFGKPTGISAEHKLGFGDLYDIIAPEIESYEEDFKEARIALDDEEAPLQIAIVGRPNAGKSTLLNQIIDEDRLITGAEAGITRDSITIEHEIDGQRILFVDTAGIRKKANIVQKLEKLSSIDSFRAIRFAQVVILLIDANSPLDRQDMALAGEILKEGRGLVFAINKIDCIKGEQEAFLREIRLRIQESMPSIDGTPIIGLSAKTGFNVAKTLQFALNTYAQWQTYISTGKLQEWLKFATDTHPPRLYKGRAIKLKYVTQIKKRPPTFAIFTNHIKPLEGSYQRYLTNSLRDYFKLNATPIRVYLRKSENPYEGKKDKIFSKQTGGKGQRMFKQSSKPKKLDDSSGKKTAKKPTKK